MPMFITLTYDNNHLPLVDLDEHINFPTLLRDDVSKFLKAYKRKYFLKNEEFQYFGCGEYGGQGRPHYHLLFFGDFQLYDAFMRDYETARNRIVEVWDKGHVHCCIAGYDGIHYVTKYCMKEDEDNLHPLQVKPFTIASNGLGMNFLKSVNAKKMKTQLANSMRNREFILSCCPDFDYFDKDSLRDAIRYFERSLPKFEIILDDGRKVFLPRAIRKKLVGSVEHFKDSPMWMLTHLRQLYNSLLYYRDYDVYDKTHLDNHSYQACLNRVEKIRKRILESKYNKKFAKV